MKPTPEYERFIADPVDQIDAALFSGDAFNDPINRLQLRSQMQRWERRLLELDIDAADDGTT